MIKPKKLLSYALGRDGGAVGFFPGNQRPEGSRFESDHKHCIETLGMLFLLTCSAPKILHFVNDLMLNNHVKIIIITHVTRFNCLRSLTINWMVLDGTIRSIDEVIEK